MKRGLALFLGLVLIFSGINVIAAPQESESTFTSTVASKLEVLTSDVYRHPFLFENKELLSLLKIDATGLKKELKKGKSLADIAEEKGVHKKKLIDLLVGQAKERIDHAVQNGRITEENAIKRKDKVEYFVARFVERKGIFRKNTMRESRIREVANILEMKEADVFAKLRNGKSIAQIAEEKGISKNQLIENLVNRERNKIAKWVDRKWKVK